MRIFTSFFLLTCLLYRITAQNLISNPSFETYSSCPNSVAQLTNATGWLMIAGHSGSPDFIHVCSTSSLVDVPNNAFGSQAPATGEGYAGYAMFYVSTPNFREYLQTHLTAPLVAGVTYELSFKTCLSDNSQYAGSEFSAYFSNSILTWTGGGWGPITTVTPQLNLSTYVSSYTNWTTLTGTYTAVGGEQYLILGNYKNDANTSKTFVGSATYSTGYYYVDDFSLQSMTPLPLEMLSFSAHKSVNHSILLNWTLLQAYNKGDFEIQRSADGSQFMNIGKVQGLENISSTTEYVFRDTAPLENLNYYRLKQIDVNGEISYSNTIELTLTAEDSKISVSPNPVTNICTVYLGNIQSNTNLYLMDISGKLLKTYEVFVSETAEMSLDLSDISAGLYFLHIPNKTTVRIAKK